MKQLGDLVDRFDTDGDGNVSYEEFVSFVSHSKREMQEMLHKVRGAIREMGMGSGRGGGGSGGDDIDDAWAEVLSVSGKGKDYVDRDRFAKLMAKKLDVSLTPGELTLLIEFVDRDGDGKVTQDDFRSFLEETRDLYVDTLWDDGKVRVYISRSLARLCSLVLALLSLTSPPVPLYVSVTSHTHTHAASRRSRTLL